MTKKKPWKQPHRPWLLAVEDPQEAGKDIGSGSFNVRAARAAFAVAAEALADAGGMTAVDGGPTWADVQARLPPCSELMDIGRRCPRLS